MGDIFWWEGFASDGGSVVLIAAFFIVILFVLISIYNLIRQIIERRGQD